MPAILSHIGLASKKFPRFSAACYTDELLSYEGLEGQYAHKVINHAVAYVDGVVHTNTLGNFWSLLKRALGGTYVSVEPFHVPLLGRASVSLQLPKAFG